MLTQPRSSMAAVPVSDRALLDELNAWWDGSPATVDIDKFSIHEHNPGDVITEGLGGIGLLSFAVMRGWCSSVRWLLSKGANPDAVWVAGLFDHHDAALLLLDAGAPVDSRTIWDETALHQAAKASDYLLPNSCPRDRNHLRLCKLLLSRGASIDAHDQHGMLPGEMCPWEDVYHQRQAAGEIDTPAEHEHAVRRLDRAAFLAEVRGAGGWNKYVDAPRQELLAFRRELPTLRRAPPPAPAHLERLFLEIPEDVFMHVLAFWRTPRDYQ